MSNSYDLNGTLHRAQGLAQAGRFQEAWAAISPLWQSIQSHGQALRLCALIAQNAGKIEECVAALERIIALEGAPPDIIGALADTLGNAGRHDEAYRQWSRLVALQPQAIDGHLNRAIMAINAGKHEAGLAAADEGLTRSPGHARLLAVRALALKNLDRLDEAIPAFETAVQAEPNRALTRVNQGVALNAACRHDEACEAFAEASRLGAKGAELHSAWGAAALEAGRVDEASDHYRRALAIEPLHEESRKALTRIGIEYRNGEGAFDHYRAIAETSGTEKSWLDWIFALSGNARHEEAAEVGRQALASLGDIPELIAATVFSEGLTGDAPMALATFEGLPEGLRDRPESLIAMGQLALRAKQPDRAAELIERAQVSRPELQIAWSLLSVAWRLLGDPREDWLCDYERLVMVAEVPSPDGADDSQEYARRVAATLDPLHVTSAAPGDQSLRQGTQTSGALFRRPEPAIAEFREAVSKAASKEIAKLPDDPNHPFLSRKSERFGFSGSWSVRLAGGGGFHIPHFHEQGWMSSAYYARLPGNVGGEQHAGCIEFGRPPKMFELDLEPRRIVQPEVGRLVLFPSYMWHGTIPFPEGSGDRLTAAFDYQPV